MPSQEYTKLKKNISELKNQFLEFPKRLNGKYTRSELNNCRAFIAFSHAEIEYYLEAMALKVLNRAEKGWDEARKVTKSITGMVAYRSKDIVLPHTPSEQNSKKKLESIIKASFQSQKSVISSNHGIKSDNLSQLFIPLGLKPEEVEESLIIQLDNFGQRRGELVHATTQVSIQHVRDPFDDELKELDFLLGDLESFDGVVRSLK